MTKLSNIKLLETFRIFTNQKTRPLIDRIVDLYKQGVFNIATGKKLANQATGRGKASQTALKRVEEYEIKKQQPPKKAQNKQTLSWYFVTGIVTIKRIYITKNTQKSVNPVMHHTTYYDKEVMDIRIEARSKEEVRKKADKYFKKKIENISFYEKIQKFVSVEITSILNEAEFVAKPPEFRPMKSAKPVKYDFIPSDDSLLKNEGFCVVDQFVGIYSKHIKKVTREWFIDKLHEMNKGWELDGNEVMDVWTLESGVTPFMLCNICRELDISHYAYDASRKCFLKFISKNKNYPALVYYNVNSHMYWISDKNAVESLVKQAREIETKVKSICLEEETKTNLYEDKEIFENIPIDKLMDYDNCVIIYSNGETEHEIQVGNDIIIEKGNKTNLNTELNDIIRLYGYIPVVGLKNKKSSITRIHFTHEGKKIILEVDPNDQKRLTWKDVKSLCEKMQIAFANQSFGVFVGQLKDKFMNQKNVRHVFSKKERKVIYEKSNQTCLCCGKEIKIKETHIDHIIPLANGGTNDEENLQLLCKPCHFEKTKHEAEQGYVKLSDTASSFNKTTLDIFNSPLCASRAFVEHVKDMNTLPLCQRQNKVFHFDINKCRKNCLRYNNFDFPLFTVMDQPKDFTKTDELKPGLYFVESDMYFPLRGNGWYSQPMIEFCLNEGYITKEQIKYSIEASLTIPSNYFNDFIDYCYTELGEFAKLSINSMIGCFKPKERENWKSMLISKDPNECFYHYLHHDGCFVESREIDDETYYIVYNKYFTNKDETEAPIYNMILDMEAIQLKKLATRIQSNKGTIIDLSTDCVSAVFPTNNQPFKTDGVNLEDFFFDDKNVVHAYKLEEKESMLKHEQLPRYTRVDHVELQPVIWNVIPDATDNDFTPLVDQILNSKLSCNLDGAAGTGKSTLLKQLMAEMDQRQLNYVALAPTNKAANIIKGITIHRFAISCSKKNIKQMKLDYILVDEVSMLQEMFYKFLCSVSRAFPNIRFILAGDFNQLEPVNDRVVNCDYKNSIALHELAGGNRVQLSKCRRSDDTLFNLIKPENIPTIDKSKFGSRFTERHIVFTNKRRIEINKNMMESQYQLKKTKAKKEPNCLNLRALDYDPNSQDVKLIVGTPIIARKNCVEMEIANNETFDVKAIKHKIKIVTISDGSRELDIKFDDFKKLFNPAYAITCHKSQGTTFNHAYTIHEWNKMSTRMKYVALSRSTDLAHINILTA